MRMGYHSDRLKRGRRAKKAGLDKINRVSEIIGHSGRFISGFFKRSEISRKNIKSMAIGAFIGGRTDWQTRGAKEDFGDKRI